LIWLDNYFLFEKRQEIAKKGLQFENVQCIRYLTVNFNPATGGIQ